MKKNIKICCIADMHNNLRFTVPEADLLLIAGDICPALRSGYLSIDMQQNFLNTDFRDWYNKQPVDHIISVAGNHDWIYEIAKNRVPRCGIGSDRKFEYIEDELTKYNGLSIYGTPVQPPFLDWAFNREEEQLIKYWDNIPEGLDILLLHCPPYGILDETHHRDFLSEHIGSKSLKKRIEEVRPKLVVFGHNHGEHGIVEEDGIKYVNASLVNEEYKMMRDPIMVEL